MRVSFLGVLRERCEKTGKATGVNETDEGDDSPSISGELLADLFGEDVQSSGPLSYYNSLPVERRQLIVVILGAALMFLPMLGAVGLWDPWESQFAEVGRQMMVRHDWVQPWWEKTWFYSKPPLTMWLTNIGLWLSGAGATTPNQEMGVWADWGVRLPIALLSIAAIAFLYLAAKRLFGQRVGLISALAAGTMPLYCILARQAITDTPFVTLLTMAMCCFLIAEFDPDGEEPRPLAVRLLRPGRPLHAGQGDPLRPRHPRRAWCCSTSCSPATGRCSRACAWCWAASSAWSSPCPGCW